MVCDLMVFCPNGAQGDSPGQRPGFDGPESYQALKGRNLSARQPIRYRTQGDASLCPGLSHFAPLGRGHHNPIVWGLSPVSRQDIVSTTVGKQLDVLPAVSTT